MEAKETIDKTLKLRHEIEKAFMNLCEKVRRSPDVVFDHWLEFIIHGWCVNDKPLDYWNYSKEQTKYFIEMYQKWLSALNEVFQYEPWYDFLGELYETCVAGIRRKQGNGQFFTPHHVCDLMSKMIGVSQQGEKTCDPCCGSGRMLLARHANNPSAYLFGKDLDRTCVLMTACNFLVHGCRGRVEWGNSLTDEIHESWEINTLLGTDSPIFGAIPHCFKESNSTIQ